MPEVSLFNGINLIDARILAGRRTSPSPGGVLRLAHHCLVID